MFIRLAYLALFILAVDLINYRGLKGMLQPGIKPRSYRRLMRAFWSVPPLFALGTLLMLLITGYPGLDYHKYRAYFYLFGAFMVLYLPRLLFSIFVLVQQLLLGLGRLSNTSGKSSYTVQKLGLILTPLAGLLVLYGMIWGKSDFKVRHTDVYIEGLPPAFEGFTIAQFSDAHLGSWSKHADVQKGLQLIRDQKADMIVFTGDMVNNIADEMETYISDFQKLKAPYGLYAILGNHDMSDYVKWKDFKLKQEYLRRLIAMERQAGFDVLLNESRLIRRGGDSLALIGVENWGLPPFKQYGDLDKAMYPVSKVKTKILLSHDPSHWTSEVVGKTDIVLTLSGHTHGMQLGIDMATWQWSPIAWKYPQWMGLYQQGSQYLYVNPGFGFIGFPGRIGIRPEISVLVLHRKKQQAP